MDHVIGLTTKGPLSTFDVTKPLLEEYLNTPEEDILDIALEYWDPQQHHEYLLSNTPPVVPC